MDKAGKDLSELAILIIDDMKSMRLTIRKMLQTLKIGSRLRFAENGKQGLELMRSARFDLVSMDWNMPVMNGVSALGEVRKDSTLQHIPIIMVTAEAERDIVTEVAETEVGGYLLKPLTLGALDKKIRTVIEKYNTPDPVRDHRNRARELEEAGDFQGAIREIKAALGHKPSASRLLRHLGLLHFKIKKNPIAEKCLLKAVAANRQDVVSRAHLADCYLKTDDLEKTGKYYLEILSLSRQYNDKAYDIGRKLLKNGSRSAMKSCNV